MTQELKNKIVSLYDSGLSLNQVAQEIGYGKTTIANILRKLGKIRTFHEAQKIRKAPNNKGGFITQKGYKVIYNAQHPKANKTGYVYEHHLIWEKYYGKPLGKNMIIHHLNGIKHDNKPENLFATTATMHHRNHDAYKKRIRELEEEISKLKQQNLLIEHRIPILLTGTNGRN